MKWLYGVACALLFTAMSTVIALALVVVPAKHPFFVWRYGLICSVCNWVFGLCYTGFLVMYRSELHGAKLYWSGVAVYAVGYFCFAVSYTLRVYNARSISVDTHTHTHPVTNATTLDWMDFVGSALFTGGSVCLVAACRPPWVTHDHAHGAWSWLWHKSVYVWWGSVLFLVGSAAFLVGTVVILLLGKDAAMALLFFQLGAWLFVPGRVYFLADALKSVV
jgi:hypothetical protein